MVINLKSQTELAGFYIVYDGSTLLETEKNYGIAHLCEHLLCKSYQHLQDEFQQKAINWNAYTSNNEVVFYITGLSDMIDPYKKKLVEYISGYQLDEEVFQNEKRIVLQEYLDSFNDQNHNHFLNLFRKRYGYYDAIGSHGALTKVTSDDVREFIGLQFKKPTKIVNVGIDFEFGDFQVIDIPQPPLTSPEIFELQRGNSYEEKSSLIILFDQLHGNYAHIKFINELLASGLNSPFYQEIREKRGLAYYVHLYLDRIGKRGLNVFATETTDENIPVVVDMVYEILASPAKFITKDRFNMVAEGWKIQRRINDINRFSQVGKYLLPNSWNVDDIIDTITYDEVMDLFPALYKASAVSVDKTEF
jgi:predicted Zn-dependent peptidase